MAWEQVNRLGVGGNSVYCLVIVVIFMGLAGVRSKKAGGLKSSYGGELKGGSHKVKWWRWALFQGELAPQVFYQNYLPISASFDLKRVL